MVQLNNSTSINRKTQDFWSSQNGIKNCQIQLGTLNNVTGAIITQKETKKDLINLAMDSYLGLNQNKKLKTMTCEVMDSWGYGFQGETPYHVQLKEGLRQLYKSNNKNYSAYTMVQDPNAFIIPLLVGKNDVLLLDEYAKSSLKDGAELSQSKIYYFKHNDVKSLEACLNRCASESPQAKTLIALEGVFEMTGEICKLSEILSVSKKFNSMVLLDESHSLGVIGENGKGTTSYFNLNDNVDIITGSLSYSLCSSGSFVLLNNKLVKQYFNQGLFIEKDISTLSAVIAATSLEIMNEDINKNKTLKENIEWWRVECRNNGIELLESDSAISAIQIKDETLLMNLLKRLNEEGLNVKISTYPIGLLKFIISSSLNEVLLNEAMNILLRVLVNEFPILLKKQPQKVILDSKNPTEEATFKQTQNKESNEHFNMPTPKIAIIGVGCRLPGDVLTKEDFWDMLVKKRIITSEIPSDRWDRDEWYSSEPIPGTIQTKHGGFVNNAYDFDNKYFSISQAEAVDITPEQRWLCELAVETMEDANVKPEELKGSQTGVFVGSAGIDFGGNQLVNTLQMSAHTMTGLEPSIFSNRLSYIFDLHGPSVTCNTACSASMTSLSMACNAIAVGDCDKAFVAGSNFLPSPGGFVAFSQLRVVSKTGSCKPFDEKADGYARLEGSCMLLIKSYEKAVEDNDKIYAVIIGSGTNEDGRTLSITLPSSDAQCNLMKHVCEKSNIIPSSIDYVEAHGTGTPTGDPIEAKSIGNAFGKAVRTPGSMPLPVGTVKGNVGHGEFLSGAIGLLKTSLMLYHKQLVPTAGYHKLNPKIDVNGLGIRVADKNEPMTKLNQTTNPLRAAINSFGFGGANANAVLEAVDHISVEKVDVVKKNSSDPLFVSLTGFSAKVLVKIVNEYIKLPLKQLLPKLYLATTTRQIHTHRVTFLLNSAKEFYELAKLYVEKKPHPRIISNVVKVSHKQGITFAFRGIEMLSPSVGHSYYKSSKKFAECVDYCDKVLQKLCGRSLINDYGLFKNETVNDANIMLDPFVSVLTNGIIQLSLAYLLRSYGINASSVIGYNVGEIAASYSAGIIGFEDAVLVLYKYCLIFEKVAKECVGEKEIFTIELGCASEQAEANILKNMKQTAYISGNDAVNMCAISGTKSALMEALQIASQMNIQALSNMIPGSYGINTPVLNKYKNEFYSSLQGVGDRCKKPVITFISTTLGQPFTGPLNEYYWWANIISTVNFRHSISLSLNEQPKGSGYILDVGSGYTNPMFLNYLSSVLPSDKIYTTYDRTNALNDSMALLNTLAMLFEKNAIPLPAVDKLWESSVELIGIKSLKQLRSVNFVLPRHIWEHKTIKKSYNKNVFISYKKNMELTEKEKEEISIQGGIKVDNSKLQSEIEKLKRQIKEKSEKESLALNEIERKNNEKIELIKTQVKQEKEKEMKIEIEKLNAEKNKLKNELQAKDIENKQKIEIEMKKIAESLKTQTTTTQISISNQDKSSEAWNYENHKYLVDHVVGNEVVFPAAGSVSRAMYGFKESRAGQKAMNNEFITMENLEFIHLAVFQKSAEEQLKKVGPIPISLIEDGDGKYRIIQSDGNVISRGRFVDNNTTDKKLNNESTDLLSDVPDLEEFIKECSAKVGGNGINASQLYSRTDELGLKYGPNFQLFQSGRSGDNVAYSRIKVDEEKAKITCHPSVLDTCFHSLIATGISNGDRQPLPNKIKKLIIGNNGYFPKGTIFCAVRILKQDLKNIVVNIFIYDENRKPIAKIEEMDMIIRQLKTVSLTNWLNRIGEETLKPLNADQLPIPQCQSVLVIGEKSQQQEISTILLPRLSQLQVVIYMILENHEVQLKEAISSNVLSPQNSLVIDVRYIANPSIDNAFLTLKTLIEHNLNIVYGNIKSGRNLKLDESYENMAFANGISGLLQVARAESKTNKIFSIQANDINKFTHGLLRGGLSVNDPDFIVKEDGKIVAIRLIRTPKIPEIKSKNFTLEHSPTGQIGKLRFREVFGLPECGPDEIIIKINSVALQFKDIMSVMNKLPGYNVYEPGMESNGFIVKLGENAKKNTNFKIGQPVFAFTHKYGHMISTYGKSHYKLVKAMPNSDMNPINYSSVVVFGTILYSIRDRAGGIKPGQSILIHSASGGVGQAAIKLCKYWGAKIYATTSVKKMQYLRDMYGLEHITDSRNPDKFYEDVMKWTNGEGVDFVLNALADEGLMKGITCLKKGGTFIEIGKKNIITDTPLGLKSLMNNISLCSAHIDLLDVDKLSSLMNDAFEILQSGDVTPIPVTNVPIKKYLSAFFSMASGNNVGKTCIIMDDKYEPNCMPINLIKENKSYLITGAFGGVGLRIAMWLQLRGAKNIILTTSGNSERRNNHPIVAGLREKGVNVTVCQCDVSNLESVKKLFKETTPEIAGIFHLANKFAPNLINRTTLKQFHTAYDPKARGALNLHLASKNYPIDMFVLFSSVLDILGNKGQAAYGAANSFLGSLVELRRSQGLCGTCISLPAMKGSGYLSQFKQERQAKTFSHLLSMLDSDDLPDFLDELIYYKMPPCIPLLAEVAKLEVETDEVAPTTLVYKHLRTDQIPVPTVEFNEFPLVERLEEMKKINILKSDYIANESPIVVGKPINLIKRSYSPTGSIDSDNTIEDSEATESKTISRKLFANEEKITLSQAVKNPINHRQIIEKVTPQALTENDVIISENKNMVKITLNRPKSMNDIHYTMMKKIMKAINVDKCLVIDSNGDDFSMGWSSADVKTRNVEEILKIYGELIEKIEKIKQPVITICKGVVLGGSMIFPCMSDIVIADKNTTFGFYDSSIKQSPIILTHAAKNRMKRSMIKKMFLVEKEIEIEEAQNFELVDIVVESSKLEMEKKHIIRRLNTINPNILKITKENIKDTGLTVESALVRSASVDATLPNGEAMNFVNVKLIESGIYSLEINSSFNGNAINMELSAQISNAFDQIKNTKDARVLIVSSTGNDFCQGFDINFLSEAMNDTQGQLANKLFSIYKNYTKTFELNIPVLCCLTGNVMAAGLALALSADWRVASKNSCLSFVSMNGAINSSVMMSHYLETFIGRGKSFDMLFNYENKIENAIQAFKEGIVQELVSKPEKVMEMALKKAREIVQSPETGINHSLDLMRTTYDQSKLMKESYKFAEILKDRLINGEKVSKNNVNNTPSSVKSNTNNTQNQYNNKTSSTTTSQSTGRRAENVGIIGITSYIPKSTVDMSKLEAHDKCSGKYTISLGQKFMALTAPNEDVVSMAMNAVKRLMKKMNLKPGDIGRIQIGTETPVDLSKSVKTFIVDKFFEEGITDIEGVDNVNACFGSTAALFDTVAWMQSEFWNGKYAIVVGTDISQGEDIYHFLSGSSAVALLIGPNANLVVEPTRGLFSNSTWDFYKPNGYKNHYPVVDGGYSIECYLTALVGCYDDLIKKTGSKTEFLDHQFGVFHNSSVSLTRKGFNTLIEKEIPYALPKDAKILEKRKFTAKVYKERVENSTLMTANMGCMYNASVLNGIISLNESLKPEDVGKRVMVYSYGSGSVAALWTLRIDGLAEKDDLVNRLKNRKEVSVDTYFEIRAKWYEDMKKFGRQYKADQFILPIRPGDYYLSEVTTDGRREYKTA